MDFSLKEFIDATLCDICEAVASARSKHGQIAPMSSISSQDTRLASNVDFDVAVVVSESQSTENGKGGKAGAGIKISIVKAEAGFDAKETSNKESQSSKTSRIRFSVPVYFQYNAEEERRLDTENRQHSTDYEPY